MGNRGTRCLGALGQLVSVQSSRVRRAFDVAVHDRRAWARLNRRAARCGPIGKCCTSMRTAASHLRCERQLLFARTRTYPQRRARNKLFGRAGKFPEDNLPPSTHHARTAASTVGSSKTLVET